LKLKLSNICGLERSGNLVSFDPQKPASTIVFFPNLVAAIVKLFLIQKFLVGLAGSGWLYYLGMDQITTEIPQIWDEHLNYHLAI
jgi:hypothetical protein